MNPSNNHVPCEGEERQSDCPVLRLGYAYVPFQGSIGKVYSPQTALREGTIFPELNITMAEYERGLYGGK